MHWARITQGHACNGAGICRTTGMGNPFEFLYQWGEILFIARHSEWKNIYAMNNISKNHPTLVMKLSIPIVLDIPGEDQSDRSVLNESGDVCVK